ncbi:MAG: DUF3108 domain-containing protein [Marinobacter sp.]
MTRSGRFFPQAYRFLSAMGMAALLAASPALAADSGGNTPDLEPVSATYKASMDKGLSINGSATRTLERQDDDTWRYEFNVDSFVADIRESVTFRWEEGRVIPLKYRYRLDGLMVKDRSRALNFNWDSDSVTGSYDGNTLTLDMEEHALDPLGFQLQLRQDLKAGKEEMTYSVVDEDEYEHDRFAVIGEETRSTRFGDLKTIKVEKVRDDDSKRETLMWFAPELDHLLVRLVQVEPDGSRYEVTLDEADLPD